MVRVAWSACVSPGIAWMCHALALWVWHVPKFFDAVLVSRPMPTSPPVKANSATATTSSSTVALPRSRSWRVAVGGGRVMGWVGL